MPNPRALIVDDEPDILELLEITLGRMRIDCRPAASLSEARAALENDRFDFCLTDMRLPDGSGLKLVERIAERCPDLPVAVITAHGNMETAVEALKAGAFDFVSKPVDLKMLRRLVEAALKLDKGPTHTSGASREREQPVVRILGKSRAVEQLQAMTRKLARSQAPVYISGESGTGKELAARLIHDQGPRAQHDFVAVNCGAIPHELMESEFFGHKKGSFTGAVADKKGLFQAADGGTLFLDEVADLPLAMQVKLLRAIQEKSVRPVGAQQEVQTDVRIISATHKDLAQMVERGEFRQDLFYRINVIELKIPPLRDRREDIPLLAERILQRISAQSESGPIELTSPALEKLARYDFPGNVRELENLLERAATLCEDDRIDAEDLFLPTTSMRAAEHRTDLPLEEYLEDIEREAIERALEETRWNRTAAARRLGITFRSLRYRMSKLGFAQDD